MNSLTWLVSILLSLTGLVVSLTLYIVLKRRSSVREFMDRQRGNEVMELVSYHPKPRLRFCSCCGGQAATSEYRSDCKRNAANAQKRV